VRCPNLPPKQRLRPRLRRPKPPTAAESDADNPNALKSPMVGTAYLAPLSRVRPISSKSADTVKEGQTF
jgi:biotin carboxyl carrier protein